MDSGEGLGHYQCTAIIDIVCGSRHKIELTPWVKTLLCEEWRCTCYLGILILCGELGQW
jgi:hypothetical protein